MSVQSNRRSSGNCEMKNDKISFALASVSAEAAELPKLLQISAFSRECKFLIRLRVKSGRSSESTNDSPRKPGNIKLIRSAQARSTADRDGRVAAAAR